MWVEGDSGEARDEEEMFAFVPVLLAAVAVIVAFAAGVWWLRRSRSAVLRPDGTQEITILVKGKYQPQAFRARLGVPLRINFVRDEDEDCSRWVIFPDFGVERTLPAYRTTTVELTPDREGDFLFTCRMGMYHGSLIVVPDRWRQPRRVAAGSRSRSDENGETGADGA